MGVPRQQAAPESGGVRGGIRRTSAFFRRRRIAFGLVLSGLVLTTTLVAIAWPDSYRVTATVAVEPARLPDDVKPLVESSIQDRIERLCRLTVSDTMLGEIARNCPRLARPRFLHVFEGGASSPQETVREKIAVERRGRGDRTELVLVTVTGEKADETAYVASRLAGVLVALDRDFRVSAASAIYSSTLARTMVDAGPLDGLKRRIEALRTENPLIATSSDAAIRAQLDQETRARDEDQIADAEVAASLPLLADEVRSWNKAVIDEAEIAQRNALAADSARGQGTREADDPRRARLVELQRQLVQALSHWTEQNPEVKRLRLEIKLERARLGEAEPEDEDAPAPLDRRTGLAPRNTADARPAADTTTNQVANRFLVEAPSY